MQRKPFIRVLMLIACLFSAAQSPLPAYGGAEPIKLGVLAFPSKTQAQAQWQPLTVVLKQAMPERDFVVIALSHPELDQAVAARQLDFVLTNGGHYVLLRNRNGLSSPLATLASDETGRSLTVFGGVIFCRAGQADINTLSDIKGKTVAAVATESQGAYQVQAYELSRVGIRLPQDVKLITTGNPHDQVVEAVLAGRADVGFVRSGVLEGMVREGKLDIKQLKILNSQVLPGFPLQISTRLYPEWPFAAMPNIDENLARRVVAVLFELDENKAATRAMGIHGFVVPADYSPVEDMLRELRLPPFDVAPSFTLQDVWTLYRWQTMGALLAGGVILSLAVSVLLMYRRLAVSHNVVLLHQQKLQESEEKFRALVESTSDWIWEVDRNGRYTYISPKVEALLGYKPEEVLGKSPFDFIPPDEVQAVGKIFGEAIVKRAPLVALENTNIHKDGRLVVLETSGVPFFDPNGEFVGYRGIDRDITERKQTAQALVEASLLLGKELAERKAAEQELQAANEQLSILLDLLPIAVYRCRADGDFAVTYMSHNVVTVTGYESRDFIEDSKLWFTHLHPDDASRLDSELTILFEKGMNTYEYRWLAADGSYRWVQDSQRLIRSEDGTPSYMVGIWQDITERNLSEKALQEQFHLLQVLIDAIPTPVFYKDTTGLYIGCNKAFQEYIGREKEQIVGKSVYDMAPKELAEAYHKMDLALFAEQRVQRYESSVMYADGTKHEVLFNKAPFNKKDGSLGGLVGVIFDITERQRAAEEVRKLNDELELKVQERTKQLLDAQEELVRKEKLAVLGQVAGSVGHELRNPLGVMNNAVYFLQTVLTDADETTREYLEIIKNEIADAERIVSDLLDAVRSKPPQPEEVNIRELIDNTLRKLTVPSSITVELDIPATLPPLWVDVMQIQQVFRNLISNAVEAMPDGGTLTISVIENRQEGTVTVSVQDSGVGMTPEQQNHLFQPLFTTKARGIGLGLVVVQNLTQANGGSVEVQSEPGKGTLFTITLPSDDSAVETA